MQSFPDLANKDNDALPAKELLAAGIRIRFMKESLRWRNLPGEAPTVVYGQIGPFIFMRKHTAWCVTRTDRKPVPQVWTWWRETDLEFGVTDVYNAPSGWGRSCIRAYTPKGLSVLTYECVSYEKLHRRL